ncbi:MAG TPA: hypothetical protein VIJ39_07105 [Solirubrobacteraceae bacterium]
MPTYAESKLAPEHYGFPIFYELLPLDAALAKEASAIESDRDAFGEEFDAYRISQLDMVRSVYAAGSAAGTAYSVRAPNGEWSSAIALADLAPLSPEQFQAARTSSWLTQNP